MVAPLGGAPEARLDKADPDRRRSQGVHTSAPRTGQLSRDAVTGSRPPLPSIPSIWSAPDSGLPLARKGTPPTGNDVATGGTDAGASADHGRSENREAAARPASTRRVAAVPDQELAGREQAPSRPAVAGRTAGPAKAGPLAFPPFTLLAAGTTKLPAHMHQRSTSATLSGLAGRLLHTPGPVVRWAPVAASTGKSFELRVWASGVLVVGADGSEWGPSGLSGERAVS